MKAVMLLRSKLHMLIMLLQDTAMLYIFNL